MSPDVSRYCTALITVQTRGAGPIEIIYDPLYHLLVFSRKLPPTPCTGKHLNYWGPTYISSKQALENALPTPLFFEYHHSANFVRLNHSPSFYSWRKAEQSSILTIRHGFWQTLPTTTWPMVATRLLFFEYEALKSCCDKYHLCSCLYRGQRCWFVDRQWVNQLEQGVETIKHLKFHFPLPFSSVGGHVFQC